MSSDYSPGSYERYADEERRRSANDQLARREYIKTHDVFVNEPLSNFDWIVRWLKENASQVIWTQGETRTWRGGTKPATIAEKYLLSQGYDQFQVSYETSPKIEKSFSLQSIKQWYGTDDSYKGQMSLPAYIKEILHHFSAVPTGTAVTGQDVLDILSNKYTVG